MTFIPRRFEQILIDQITRLVARTALSDVADSSSVKQMLAASAREDDEIYFQMQNILQMFDIDSATGDDLDERAAEVQPGTIVRIGPRAAVGQVVFSRSGTAGTVNIATGTRVKTGDGVVFTTTTAGQITPTSPQQVGGHGVGRDSNLVSVVAEAPGITGNVVAATIIKFDSKPAGVDEVTNLTQTTLGRNKESDDSFRQRIKDFIAGLARCTVTALEVGVLGVEDTATGDTVLFSKAVEDIVNLGNVTLFIDNGTGSAESSTPVVGENVTLGLLGPPADSAVGGETELFLDNKPIKISVIPVLSSSIRGALVFNTDYTINPASSQVLFTPALVATEVITAGYTHFTGLIQLAQKVIDGDPADRTNFPGFRAAGVLVRVLTPQALIQTVTATLTVHEGFVQATVAAEAETKVIEYINGLGISDDVVRNEIIRRIQALAGVADLILSAPTTNIAILDDQLARTTAVNVTIT